MTLLKHLQNKTYRIY